METGHVHEPYLRAPAAACAGQRGPLCLAGLEAKDLLWTVHGSVRSGITEILVAVPGAHRLLSVLRLSAEHRHRAVSVSGPEAGRDACPRLDPGRVAGRAGVPAGETRFAAGGGIVFVQHGFHGLAVHSNRVAGQRRNHSAEFPAARSLLRRAGRE